MEGRDDCLLQITEQIGTMCEYYFKKSGSFWAGARQADKWRGERGLTRRCLRLMARCWHQLTLIGGVAVMTEGRPTPLVSDLFAGWLDNAMKKPTVLQF